MKKGGLIFLSVVLLITLGLYLSEEKLANSITSAAIYDPESYKYPDFINSCDRFRPIFESELEKYSLLKEIFDLPLLYSLTYQESMCQTKDELQDLFIKNDDKRQTWQGGIMQVDGCWRGQLDCSTVRKQIENGIKQLDFSYSIIDRKLKELGPKDLPRKEKIKLLLISYNRGYFVIDTALELLKNKEDQGDYLIDGLTKKEGDQFYVFVNCPETDRCSHNKQYLEVSGELPGFASLLDRALLLACRSKFGLMKNEQGDYCTGQGYGLLYPEETFRIYQEVVTGRKYPPRKEKEFYIDEISFSGYDWFVKKSINKSGPGSNYFYYDHNSAYLDDKGQLHLRLLNRKEKWYSSEVVLSKSLGYGKYTFFVEGDLTKLGPQLVLGLFTYDLSLLKDPEYYHREIDVEISCWGSANSDNFHFTVQEEEETEPAKKINISYNQNLIISFDWQKDYVVFEVRKDDLQETLLHSWAYHGSEVPAEGKENARINLWIFDEPLELEETEVVVKRFQFEGKAVFGQKLFSFITHPIQKI